MIFSNTSLSMARILTLIAFLRLSSALDLFEKFGSSNPKEKFTWVQFRAIGWQLNAIPNEALWVQTNGTMIKDVFLPGKHINSMWTYTILNEPVDIDHSMMPYSRSKIISPTAISAVAAIVTCTSSSCPMSSTGCRSDYAFCVDYTRIVTRSVYISVIC